MNYLTAWTLCLSLGTGVLAADTSTIRPGLWEHTSTIKTQSGEMEESMKQMQQQMASMPPEQRKMMEKMMASQGVEMSPKGNTVKVCVTKQDAQLSLVSQQDKNCKQQIVRKKGNTMWFKYSCTGPNPSSGEGEYTFVGDKAYKGKMTVRTKNQGKSEVVQMNQSGKWLSDNCGKLKPLAR